MKSPGLRLCDIHALSERLIRSDTALDDVLMRAHPNRIQTVNLQHLHYASKDDRFKSALLAADFITADGWPVAALFTVCGSKTHRVTGSDLAPRLLKNSHARSLRFGLLGTSSAVGDILEREMALNGIGLSYREHGRADNWDCQLIAGELNDAAVNVLLVAVTSPIGEFVAEHVHRSGFRGTTICIGGAVDMLAGTVPRAPRLARRIGMEWAFRLAAEPRRLWRRYLVDCLGNMLTIVIPLGVAGGCKRLLRRL